MKVMGVYVENSSVPTVQLRELYPASWDRTWWKIVWEKKMYMCVCDWIALLYSRNWHNIINLLELKEQNKTGEVPIVA